MKHLTTCTVHYLTFGGHCLNCGLNALKLVRKTKEERKEYLKTLGFKFPE